MVLWEYPLGQSVCWFQGLLPHVWSVQISKELVASGTNLSPIFPEPAHGLRDWLTGMAPRSTPCLLGVLASTC